MLRNGALLILFFFSFRCEVVFYHHLDAPRVPFVVEYDKCDVDIPEIPPSQGVLEGAVFEAPPSSHSGGASGALRLQNQYRYTIPGIVFPGLLNNPTGDVTVCFWLLANTRRPYPIDVYLFEKEDVMYFRLLNSTGNIESFGDWFIVGLPAVGLEYIFDMGSGEWIVPGQWYHICMVYESGTQGMPTVRGSSSDPKSATLYINKRVYNPNNQPSGPASAFNDVPSDLVLGVPPGPSLSIDGYIDNIIFFNLALSENDVDELSDGTFPDPVVVDSASANASRPPLLFNRPSYDAPLFKEVTFDSTVECSWRAVSCDDIVSISNSAPTQVTFVGDMQPGVVRMQCCRRYQASPSILLTNIEFASAVFTNVKPIIVVQLDNPLVLELSTTAVLTIDVFSFPEASTGFVWEYFGEEETNTTTRIAFDGSEHSKRTYTRVGYDVVMGQAMGVRGGTGNGTWLPFQNGNNRSFAITPSIDLNGTLIRVRISNSAGTVTSNETVLRIVQPQTTNSDGEGGGVSAAVPASVASAGILLCLVLCLLSICCVCALVILTGAFVSSGGVGLFGVQRHMNAKLKETSGLLKQMRSQWNVAYEDLDIEQELGSGAFGTVHMATWRGTNVAVKQMQLKSEEQIESFLAEAELMKKIRPHPSVVQLYGVCTDVDSPMCIIMEFLRMGDLLRYLRAKGIPSQQMAAMMAYDTAAGMSHLAAEGIIHRDLAARNLLLTEGLRVKVGDFGMSLTHSDGDRDVSKGMIGPIRWMAPELLRREEVFSEKTDVYAYAITLFEIYSGGTRPYPSLSTTEAAIAVVNDDARPEIPECAPPYIVDIMKMCWDTQQKQRPRFKEIAKMIKSGTKASLSPSIFGSSTLGHSSNVDDTLSGMEEYNPFDASSYSAFNMEEYTMDYAAMEDKM